MATSGVTTFSLSRDSIINSALRKLGVVSKGQVADPLDITNGAEALNVMLEAFVSKGMPLWAIREYTFNLTATRVYPIGVGLTLNTPAPFKVLQAYNTDSTSGNSIPMNVQTHYNYNLVQPQNTTSVGTPVNIWYEPLNQTGNIHIWPQPDSYSITNRTITISYQRPFEQMVNSTDTLDFPQNWMDAVIFGLAWRLSSEYGLSVNDRQILRQEAEYHLDEALSFGTEEGSLFFQPDWQGKREV